MFLFVYFFQSNDTDLGCHLNYRLGLSASLDHFPINVSLYLVTRYPSNAKLLITCPTNTLTID